MNKLLHVVNWQKQRINATRNSNKIRNNPVDLYTPPANLIKVRLNNRYRKIGFYALKLCLWPKGDNDAVPLHSNTLTDTHAFDFSFSNILMAGSMYQHQQPPIKKN